MENPSINDYKWMISGGTPISGNLHLDGLVWFSSLGNEWKRSAMFEKTTFDDTRGETQRPPGTCRTNPAWWSHLMASYAAMPLSAIQ